MNIDIELQEILATIDRNQRQIDLLVANNTQLTRMLLMQGMQANHRHVNVQPAPPRPAPVASLPAPQAAPPNEPARRGRPPGGTNYQKMDPEEKRRRMSEAAKARWESGVYDHIHASPGMKQKKHVVWTPEMRKRKSEQMKKKWREGGANAFSRPGSHIEGFEL